MPNGKEITLEYLLGISGTLPREKITPGNPALAEAGKARFRDRRTEPNSGVLDQGQPETGNMLGPFIPQKKAGAA